MTEDSSTEGILQIVKLLVGESLNIEGRQPDDITPSSSLIGDTAIIDSVNLVILIVALEERIEAEFGQPILLSEDGSALEPDGPFRSIPALVKHVENLVSKAGRE